MRPTTERNGGNAAGELTRQRLLETAACSFAERGYAGTSVRDITARAQCNIGAVNYYFGGKQGLYIAVFEQRLGELTERRVGALRALPGQPELTLKRVLETFADVFLEPLEGERGRQTLMLIMRDMLDSHLPTGMFVAAMIEPTMKALVDALSRASPGLQPQHAWLCAQSLVAQLLHVIRSRSLHLDTLRPGISTASLEDTVAHIVGFTAAGIRAYQTPGITR